MSQQHKARSRADAPYYERIPRFFDVDALSRSVIDIETEPRIFGLLLKPRTDRYNQTVYRAPAVGVRWRQQSHAFGIGRDSVYGITCPHWPPTLDEAVFASFVRGQLDSAHPVTAANREKYKLFYGIVDAIFAGVLDMGTQYSPDGSLVQSWQYSRGKHWRFDFHRMTYVQALAERVFHQAEPDVKGGLTPEEEEALRRENQQDVVEEVQSAMPMPENTYDPMSIFSAQYATQRSQVTLRATSFSKTFGIDASVKPNKKVLIGCEAFYSAVSELPNVALGFSYSTDGFSLVDLIRRVSQDPFAREDVNRLASVTAIPKPIAAEKAPSSSSPSLTESYGSWYGLAPYLERVPLLSRWLVNMMSWGRHQSLTCAVYGNATGSLAVSVTSSIPAPLRTVLSTRFVLDYPIIASSWAVGASIFVPPLGIPYVRPYQVQARYDSDKGLGLRLACYLSDNMFASVGMFSRTANPKDVRYSVAVDIENPFTAPVKKVEAQQQQST